MTFFPAYSESECYLPSLPDSVKAGAFCPSKFAIVSSSMKNVTPVYHSAKHSIKPADDAEKSSAAFAALSSEK